jgi:hypothetical protein
MWLITATPPDDIFVGRKKRATGADGVLEIPSGPDWLGSWFNALVDRWGLILALRLLALVDLLFQPSLDGLSTVSHVTAHPVADWAAPLVSPAVQGVNGDAQHFRDICERHQLVTGLECHDHLPFRGSRSGSVLGPPSQRGDQGAVAGAFGQAARPDRSTGRRLATVKTLSREATVGGREQQQELNSHEQLGRRNPRGSG